MTYKNTLRFKYPRHFASCLMLAILSSPAMVAAQSPAWPMPKQPVVANEAPAAEVPAAEATTIEEATTVAEAPAVIEEPAAPTARAPYVPSASIVDAPVAQEQAKEEELVIEEAALPATEPEPTPPAPIKAEVVAPATKNLFETNFTGLPTLVLGDAISKGLHENPDVQIAAAQLDQTQLFVKQGQATYYPRIELSLKGEEQFNDPASGFSKTVAHANIAHEKALTLNQLLFDGFSTIEEVSRRKQLVTSAEIRAKGEEERVLLEIITHYSTIGRYQKTVVDAKNFIVEMQNITDKIALMEDAGGASQAQLDFAKSRLAFAKTELNTAISSLNDAMSNLEFLTGKLDPFQTQMLDDLRPDDKTIEFYMELANKNNTSILLNRSDKQALAHKLEVEYGAYYPSLNFNVEAREKYNDGGLIGWDTEGKATLQMNYVLFEGNARGAASSRVKSQISELDIRDRKNYVEVEKNIKLSYNQIRSIRETLKAVEDEIASNETLRTLNRQNLELGNINIMELIDVEERLYSARSRKQQILTDLIINTYTLLQQTGVMDKNDFTGQRTAQN